MTQSLIQKLNHQYNILISSPQQLKNGNTLMNIALKVLYQGSNPFIESKLAQAKGNHKSTSPLANSNKAGNNVLIINSLLKHIKSDDSIDKQTWIKELTFYNLLENQQALLKFINWMMDFSKGKGLKNEDDQDQYHQHHQTQQQTLPLKLKKKSLNENLYQDMTQQQINAMSSNRFRNLQIDHNPRFKTQQHEPQNDFDNLYFASNLKNKPIEQPIVISPQKGDKIVRKGSFKLLKPKVTFVEDKTNQQPKEYSEPSKNIHHSKPNISQHQTSKLSNFYQPDELKQISMIQPSNHLQNQNLSQNLSHHQNFYPQNPSQIYEHQNIPKKPITQTPLLTNKQIQVQNRKTIPKNLSKPPLCRSSSRKNKQNIQNGPSDKDKTVQQSLKKKNFFNFNQSEDIVSTFNYEMDNKETYLQKQESMNMGNDEEDNYESTTSRSKVFAKIKDLGSGEKNEIRQYMSLEGQGTQGNNIIEENCYTIINKTRDHIDFNNNKQQNDIKYFNNPNESSSKLLKLKNHFLQKQLYNLERQISKQQSSLHQLSYQQPPQSYNQPNRYQSGHKRSTTSLHQQKQYTKSSINKNSSFDSVKKSNRKVSKIHLHQLQLKQKQMIIDWLDSLHFVDKSKLTQDQIFENFKDGTKFVQLCNHYIGRGKPLAYFSNPKKNAQIHSNYSKVFDYLKSYSQWDHPQLLFAYELFVPYPQESPVWNLLLGMFKLLTKKGKTVQKSANKQESLIYTKQSQSERKISVKKQFQVMETNAQKQQDPIAKTLDFNSHDKKNYHQQKQTSRKSVSSSRKQSNFAKPIQFVKQIPQNLKHNDLIQQNQELESCTGSDQYTRQNQVNMNVYFEGYKDRYMRKTLQNSSSKEKSKCASLQTPKKFSNQINQHEQSFIYPYGQSINRGSIRRSSSKKMLENQLKKMENSSCKLLSAKKSQRESQKTRQFPKISLNMQMKVQKILKYFGLNKLIDEKNAQKLAKFQLLQDPIRNGTLINILLNKFVPALNKYIQGTKSIEHCRQNYMNFYALIKNKYGQEGFEMIQKYLDFTEDILKGEKTLFYGIAYSLTQLMEKKGFRMIVQEESYDSRPDRLENNHQAIGTYRAQKQRSQSMIQSFKRNHIEWVRYLQRSNPKVVSYKIRTQQDLRKSIYSGVFLYAFTQNNSIKPIYMNPCNTQQRQANLKKVICYLVQNKIALQKEDFYNVKSIGQCNNQLINGLMDKLVRYSVQKYGVGAYQQNLNLYINNDENDNITSNRVGLVMNTHNSNNMKPIGLSKYLQDNNHYEQKHPGARLQTTTAEYINETNQHNHNNIHNYQNIHSHGQAHNSRQSHKHQQPQRPEVWVQIPWMRKLGFTNCSLSINNGIILCRLISKLTRTNIKFNQNISTDAKIPKAESLGYIRKAIKLIPSFKFDQIDIYEADEVRTLQVYDLIKDKFRNTYELTKILTSK